MRKRTIVLETNLRIPEARLYRGKVSDVYFLPGLGSDYNSSLPDMPIILRIFCDRISANNLRLSPGIPNQGANMASLQTFWSGWIPENIGMPTHFLSNEIANVFGGYNWLDETILDRSIVTLSLRMLLIENITRYIVRAAGSGWKQYCKDQTICGIPLPAGLKPGDKFPKTLWTPTDKSDTDPWITRENVILKFGPEMASRLEKCGVDLQEKAYEYLLTKGLILSDNKTELGEDENGKLYFADEYLTPHSCCLFDAKAFSEGRIVSRDKDIAREYLDKNPGTTVIPSDLVKKLSFAFSEVTEIITGKAA